jgi:excisionase family DNA binding protein
MSNKIYTATQAAKILGVTTQCVSNLIKRNRIKADRDGKHWKIPTESIITYVNLRMAELSVETKELKETLKFLQ